MIKKNIKYTNFFILFFVLFFICSCSPSQMKVENLIKAPKLTGKFYEIDSALKSVVGENITLKYPKSGDYRSPFILYDIDKDGKDEAIVFYLDDENNIKFSVLDRVSNKWTSIFSTVGPGVDVEKILISNISDSNTNQIIVNWIKPNGVDHSLQVYNYEKDSLKCIYNKDYLTDVFMFDLDNDSKDELIIIDKTLKITPKIEVIKKIDESGELGKIFYAKLLPGALDYKKITMGQIIEGVNAIFLDSQIEDLETSSLFNYTEVICFNKNQELKNLFYDKTFDSGINENLLTQTTRSQDVFCKDIDSDNIIEIPKTLIYHFNPELKLETKYKMLSLSIWQKYKDNNLEISGLSVENIRDGYSFVFPNNWFKINQYQVVEPLVLVFYNEKEQEIIFKTNDQNLDEIMSIKILELTDEVVNDSVNKSSNQYFELERKNNFVYYVKINNQNDNFKINLKDIKKYFSITYRR